MASVTVSSKYQIVIPLDIRERALVKPGAKLDVLYHDGCIHLIPIRSLKSLQGKLKLGNTDPARDETERAL